jgi:hypothetical protein
MPCPWLPTHTFSAIQHAAPHAGLSPRSPSPTYVPHSTTRPASGAACLPHAAHYPGLPWCPRRPPFPRTASCSLTRWPVGSRGRGADLVKDLLGAHRRRCGLAWEARVLSSCSGRMVGGIDPGSGAAGWWAATMATAFARRPLLRARRRRCIAELRTHGDMPLVRFSFTGTTGVSRLFYPCSHYMYACSFCAMLQNSVTRLPFNRSVTLIFGNWMLGCFRIQ